MTDDDRARAVMIDGLIADLAVVGGPDVRRLQQRIAALEKERDNYKTLCDSLTSLEKLGDMAQLTTRLEQAERERDEERARLRDAVAKSSAIYAAESEKGRSIDRSVTSAETLSSVMWSSGRLHGLGTIHDLLLGLLGALGDYRANAEAEAAAPGAAEKLSGGD